MAVITLLFIGLFFAAWKAPAWVKEIGIAALVVGVIWSLIGCYQAGKFIQNCDEPVQQCVLAGGIAVGLIPTIYGLLVYLVSLVIRVVQKPRI